MRSALLLSGGMDSVAIAYWKRPELAITVDYGQKAAPGELRAASAVAGVLGIEHHVISVDLSHLGSGCMAGNLPHQLAPIPEWWPFRNQMLVTLAAMQGLSLAVDRILIGSIRPDSQHRDGSPDFVTKMDEILATQEGGIRLEAPAIELTAVELVHRSGAPLEILAWAHSCHVTDFACGLCRGCRKHYETMEALGEQPY